MQNPPLIRQPTLSLSKGHLLPQGEKEVSSPLSPARALAREGGRGLGRGGIYNNGSLPTPLQKLLHQHYPTHDFNTLLLALWLVYLYRLGNQPKVGVLLQLPCQKASHPSDLDPGIHARTSLELPYFTALQDGLHFGQVVSQLQAELLAMQQKSSYLPDIFYRYPTLTEVKQAVFTAVVMGEVEQLQKSHAALVLMISAKDRSLSWHVDQKCLAQEPYLKTILQQMPGHLETLLTAITTQPETSIADLALLTPQEQQQILIDWNQTDIDYPRDKTIPQLFEEQVQKHPNKIAVCFENQSLTYRELNQQANQLAHYLRQQGVVAETLVAICMERSIEMIIGILGILKAGGAYVPIDPESPSARIEWILQDTGCRFAVQLGNELSGLHNNVINIEEIFAITENNVSNVSLDIAEHDLANVIYTSGSTGKPKGVLVEHGNLVATFHSSQKIYGFNESDVWSCVHAFNFDFSVWEIFGALLHGGSLIILPKEVIQSAETLYEVVISRGITVFSQTPTAFYQFAEIDRVKQEKLALRYVIFGGEKLSFPALSSWFARHGFDTPCLVNMYGITESTIHATFLKSTEKEPWNLLCSNIGKPLASRAVYVLDHTQKPIPLGAVGELYLSGSGIARGYLNLPEETQQRFLNLSIHSELVNVYKTGDLVRWLPDGNLEYIGRIDDQIKLRGFRIELGEIEKSLTKVKGVQQAVVITYNTPFNQTQLIAFVVLSQDPNHTNDAESLKITLKSWLSSYMIPQRIYTLNKIPLNKNGKIDKKQLARWAEYFYKMDAPAYSRDKHFQESLQPGVLSLLKQIFEETFKTPVKITDDFFALGGDSIVAMQLCAAARKYGITIQVRQIFENSSIEMLADKVQLSAQSIHDVKPEGRVALTPIQHWFFNLPLAKKEQFSQACLLKLSPHLDLSKIRKSIELLISTYHTLRLRFEKIGSHWTQYYDDHPLQAEDLIEMVKAKNADKAQWDKVVDGLIRQAHLGFDLRKGPLAKFYLIKNNPALESYLLIVIHHLLIDGVSWRVLLEDMEKIYSAHVTKSTVQGLLGSSFKSWSQSLQGYVYQNKNHKLGSYWKAIEDQQVTIPKDFNLGENLYDTTCCVEISFTSAETKLLTQIAQQNNTRVHEILLTALAKVVSEWIGAIEFSIDLESHGRSEVLGSNYSQTMGWFTSLFPVKLHYDQSHDFMKNLEEIKQELGSIPNDGIDYGVFRYLNKKRKPKKYSQEISFNYWGRFDQVFAQGSPLQLQWIKPVSYAKNLRTHVISIEAMIKHQRLHVYWEYSNNLHSAKTIHGMATSYRDEITRFIANFPRKQPENFSFPLTPLQKGILFQSISSQDSGAYIAQYSWKINQLINTPFLQKTLSEIIARHESLRTRFVWENVSEALQVVEQHCNFLWQEYDWTEVPEQEHQKRLHDFLQADREASFSLDKLPLLRAVLIRTSPESSILVFTFHHCILDGWSMSLLLNELAARYSALGDNKILTWEPSPKYLDYVHWLQRQNRFKARQFWQDYLKNISINPGLLSQVGILFPQNQSHSIKYCLKEVDLGNSLSHSIRSFLKTYKLTLSAFFQSIWGLLLHRYTQADDILFGTTISLRPAEINDVNKMLGLLINTLPVRLNYTKEMSVLEYLQTAQKNMFGILDHSYASLSDIQEWIANKPKSASHELFETLLVVENYPIGNLSGLGTSFDEIEIYDPTHYALTLAVIPQEKISLKFAYDASRINHTMLTQLVEHFQNLIEEGLIKPHESVFNLNILSAEEQNQILIKWNQNREILKYENIKDWFEYQVQQTPDNNAIFFQSKSMTYSTLNSKANQLAHYLQEQLRIHYHTENVADTLFALTIDPGFEIVIAMLAVIKIGAAYLPIDSSNPLQRIEYILNDCKTKFLITQNHLINRIKPIFNKLIFKPVCISINLVQPDIETKCKNNLLTTINKNDLAYVVYTSGSTGNPKGVMISHLGITNTISSAIKQLDLTEHDKILQFASCGFDASVWEIYTALLIGANLVMTEKNQLLPGNILSNTIKENEISVVTLPPSILETVSFIDYPYLKTIIVAGEACSIQLMKQWSKKRHHLVNAYGPTEASVCATMAFCDFQDERCFIGKAINNVSLYVLNQHLQPVPIGVIGELYIGGYGLARGYLNNGALSKKYFNFVKIQNNVLKLYKTGDLVRWSPGGMLEFMGRVDSQVKIRGFRIELGEVERMIKSHPFVVNAVVLVKNIYKYKQLVAYVIKKNKTLNAQELYRSMNRCLPEYMTPKLFVFIEKFPLTKNGKIDKEGLPSHVHGDRCHRVFEPPRSKEEKNIIHLWKKVLQTKKPIGIRDNFFELGGNSLSILQILSWIQKIFNVELVIRDFLIEPTVIRMAELISTASQERKLLEKVLHQDLDQKHRCLISLRSGENNNPLFLIHPVGGTVFWYISLSHYMQQGRPIYAIQDPSIDTKNIIFNTVEEMATYYISIIRSVQKHGPYLIAGASGGANISVEIAKQLQILGEEVGFVGLLDGWAAFPQMLEERAFFEANMRRQYNAMKNKFQAKGISNAEHLLALQWHRSQMFRAYKTPFLNTKLTLFKATVTVEIFKNIDGLYNHWEQYSPFPIELYLVPGGHESMFQEPNVKFLAKVMDECLSSLEHGQNFSQKHADFAECAKYYYLSPSTYSSEVLT